MIPKVDLGVGEMGFIFYGTYSLLVTRTEVSDPGPMGPPNQHCQHWFLDSAYPNIPNRDLKPFSSQNA